MIRFLISFCVVAIMAIPTEAQLFQRVQRTYQPAFQSCPGGVCPVPMQFVRTPVVRTVPAVQVRSPVVLNHPIVNPVVVAVPVVSTVVNPSFAPDPDSSEVQAAAIGDTAFHRTVRKASSAEVRAGRMTRFQQAKLLGAVRLTGIGAATEELAGAEMVTQGAAVDAQGLIDWENFDPEKFAALIEQIIKILLMFGIGA